ncbi:hypothetical protein PF010_g12371 [Phytophthora fragariae]|uniref:Uncharacterized protein n=1 Tax=Phytophthora fragariae TaxID=53985 RepID=A0A6G0L2Z6_9STRA|nr:hypothetical protein PF010_g12371 [Phytophthora fragariae]
MRVSSYTLGGFGSRRLMGYGFSKSQKLASEKARFITQCFSAIMALSMSMVDRAASATEIQAVDFYSSAGCEGTPDLLVMWPSTNCTVSSGDCEEAEEEYQVASCISDPYAHTAEVYGGVPYVLVDMFDDSNCEAYKGSFAMRATGDCIVHGQHSVLVAMNANGSATVEDYNGRSCSDQDFVESHLVDGDWFESYICADEGFVFYNNAFPGTSGSGSLAVADNGDYHHFKSHLPAYLAHLRAIGRCTFNSESTEG